MNEEQKELLIWGGGGLAIIILLAWVTASQAGQVATNNQRVDTVYPEYQRLYASIEGGNPDRKLLSEAVQLIEAAQLTQETIRSVLEKELLTTLDPKVENSQRVGGTGAALFSYNQVVDEVDSRYRSLRSKAARLNIPELPSMPHEGADQLSRGDESGQLQLRSWQLAEVLMVHGIVDQLFDLGIHRLNGVEIVPPIADNSDQPTYVSLGVRLTMVIDLVNADRLLNYLRETEKGLDLESISMTSDQNTEGRFTVDITIRQTSAWPERWDPGLVLGGAGGGAAAPSSGRRSTSRGRQ